MTRLSIATMLAIFAIPSQADPTHRYSFTTDASDTGTVGGANGTLQNVATVAGGQLQMNNPAFPNNSVPRGYLSLPPSILPSSGSVTIEQWFTFGGSGFFTEAYTFTNHNDTGSGPTNPPGAGNGQYLVNTISNPDNLTGTSVPGAGSSVAQATTGFSPGNESRAFGSTVGLGFAGGGYLDNGQTYMAATVIDGAAGTLSYYVTRVGDGLGGLQQTIAAIPLSSYSFTNAYLGRSPFPADNYTNGSVDEFRIYNEVRSTAQIARDFAAGPDKLVPEPKSLVLAVFGGLGLLAFARRRS